MTDDQWLAFTPRDTVLVRDGRSFDAGSDTVAESTLPGPSTVAGAVHAAYGQDAEEVRGPLLARHDGYAWQTFLPTPLDLVRVEGEDPCTVHRLAALPLDVTTDLTDHCPLWMVGEGDPVGGFISGNALSRYLNGELVPPDGSAELDEDDLPPSPFQAEARIGLARTEERTARTGLLYQSGHLRPVDGLSVLALCVAPADGLPAPAGPVKLGGRGRLADVEAVEGISWPEYPDEYPNGRVLVYLATPAIWPDGWRIPVPPDASLVAAATGPPQAVAMASPRTGFETSRQLRWAVPAGSVYLLEFTGGPDAARKAREWAHDIHGKAYAPGGVERLRTAGFGVVLTGAWH